MMLPEGKNCGMCYAYHWCKGFFGCKPENIECDYFPVRFKSRAPESEEAANTSPADKQLSKPVIQTAATLGERAGTLNGRLNGSPAPEQDRLD